MGIFSENDLDTTINSGIVVKQVVVEVPARLTKLQECAPELLKALEILVDADPDHWNYNTARQIALKAIARAKGE